MPTYQKHSSSRGTLFVQDDGNQLKFVLILSDGDKKTCNQDKHLEEQIYDGHIKLDPSSALEYQAAYTAARHYENRRAQQ
jgi:hypothetical protein